MHLAVDMYLFGEIPSEPSNVISLDLDLKSAPVFPIGRRSISHLLPSPLSTTSLTPSPMVNFMCQHLI